MKEQFTRGEWVFNGYDGSITDTTKAKNEIAMMNVEGWDNLGEGYANAHLIAQAPEMYEMLKAIDTCIADSKNEIELADMVTNLCHDIDQLLAKCRGEE